MARPSKYPQERRERAVRIVIESKGDYETEYATIESTSVGVIDPKWSSR